MTCSTPTSIPLGNVDRRRHVRGRWAAIGAALAVSLGAGGMSLVDAAGEPPSTYVPITPCRVFDTRTGIGPQHGPLGPDQAVTFPITGDQGECSGIPTEATAVALNVTALDATAWSFLTIWPSDAAKPNASSLNYVPGQGPTPNGVIADLSAGGTIDLHNFDGSVQVIGDVNGYFLPGGASGGLTVDAYSRAESDATFATKTDTYTKNETYSRSQIDMKLAPKPKLVAQTVSGLSAVGDVLYYDGFGTAVLDPADPDPVLRVDLPMPVGARLTHVGLTWRDNSSATMAFYLYHRTLVTGGGQLVTPYGIDGFPSTGGFVVESLHDLPSDTPVLAGNAAWMLEVFAPPHTGVLALRAVTYTYEIDG